MAEFRRLVEDRVLNIVGGGGGIDAIVAAHSAAVQAERDRWTEECSVCKGTGWGVEFYPSGVFSGKKQSSPCRACKGTGRVAKRAALLRECATVIQRGFYSRPPTARQREQVTRDAARLLDRLQEAGVRGNE